MSLNDINGILNQFGINMIIVDNKVHICSVTLDDKMPDYYKYEIKKIESRSIKDLLNGENIYISHNDYRYNFNILLKDNKYLLENLSIKSNDGSYNLSLSITKDYTVNNAYTIYYHKESDKINYDKMKFYVNSKSPYATVEYNEEDMDIPKASFYAIVSNKDNHVSVSKTAGIYTTLLSFDDVLARTPEIAKILEIIAPELYAKCLMINELNDKKRTL